jgi:hypothetical protein
MFVLLREQPFSGSRDEEMERRLACTTAMLRARAALTAGAVVDKRATAHARAQAARAQKSIETVSQTERCNITGGEPAAALALRT